MRSTAIVCEFNPIHKGHKYLLDSARNAGNDCIICVMSGNAVQRGEFAVADKYTRAETALAAGADLVLELPYPYSASSAEYFCTAAVGIADGIGADGISFGSECGDIEKLMRLAEQAESVDESDPNDRCDGSIGTAEEWLGKVGRGEPIMSNDILGIGYITAIRKLGSELIPVAYKRIAAGYNDTDEASAGYSATALRKVISDGRAFGEYLPDGVTELFETAERNGLFPVTTDNIGNTLLAMLRMTDDNSASICAECGGGVGQRIVSVAKKVGSFSQFEKEVATKKYTNARLRRAALFLLTGVMQKDLEALPEYTVLLAANSTGCRYLAETRYARKLNIVTKPTDIPNSETVRRQAYLSERLDSIFTLALPETRDSGYFLRKSPTIIV